MNSKWWMSFTWVRTSKWDPWTALLGCQKDSCLLTRVQLLALGSNSVTLVICFRKSDSCIPGWEPRLLNCARGFARITWRFTAKPERRDSWPAWIRSTLYVCDNHSSHWESAFSVSNGNDMADMKIIYHRDLPFSCDNCPVDEKESTRKSNGG